MRRQQSQSVEGGSLHSVESARAGSLGVDSDNACGRQIFLTKTRRVGRFWNNDGNADDRNAGQKMVVKTDPGRAKKME